MIINESPKDYSGCEITSYSLVSGPEDDEIIFYIGKSLVECARLEHVLKQIYAYKITTNEISFRDAFLEIERKGRGLSAYADALKEIAVDQEIKALLSEIANFSDLRNNLAHGVLARTKNNYVLVRSKAEKKPDRLDQFLYPICLSELQIFSQKLALYRAALYAAFKDEMGTSAGVFADKIAS